MRRQTRILIVELVGALVAILIGVVLLVGASVLLDGIKVLSDQVVPATSQGEISDPEGYGMLVNMLGLALGDVGIMAVILLAFVEIVLAIGSLLFTIIARVAYRPGKRGRYVVLTALALAPLAIIAIVAFTFAFGDTTGLFWTIVALIEVAVVAYGIFETIRLLKGDDGAGPGEGSYDGDYVPAPEDAR
ncbi:MAG: hypothetical protein ACOYIP_01145 [Coriobacteriales bacterium]|jgi:hypothetical protein